MRWTKWELRSERRFWYGFGACIGVPAVLLAAIGWRAVALEKIERFHETVQQQNQIAMMAETSLDAAMSRVERDAAAFPAEAFDLLSSGGLEFPFARVYFGDDQRGRLHTPSLLAEGAQAAEAQGRTEAAAAMYRRLLADPDMHEWASVAIARMEAAGQPQIMTGWLDRFSKTSMAGVSPDGYPVALIGADVVESLPAGALTASRSALSLILARLRSGSWWLSYAQRQLQDEALRRAVVTAGGQMPPGDQRLVEIGEIETAVRRLTGFRRDTPARLTLQIAGRPALLVAVAGEAPGTWSGHVFSAAALRSLLDTALGRIRSEAVYPIAVREQTTAAVVWGDAARAERGAPLRGLPGWELALGDPGPQRNRAPQILSYAMIVLLVLVLAFGIAVTAIASRREADLARRQSAFASGVTHEFKSPITTIQLLMERIAAGRVSSPDVLRDYSAAISRETARLEHLVNRLLQAHKIQAGESRYHMAPHCIADIVNSSMGHFRALAQARDIRLEADVDDVMREVGLDRTAIQDSLQNLIDNAINYSPDGSCIEVKVRHEANAVRISVRDQGIGIEPSELPRIFARFYRGKRGAERWAKGTGLGLWLVKAAAEAHGGSVRVTSVPGQGSEFCLILAIREEDICLES